MPLQGNKLISSTSLRKLAWAMLAILFLAAGLFRQIFFKHVCLFTTDDNIGLCNLAKHTMPESFLWWWQDAVLLGMPSGSLPLTLNNVLLWLAPITLYFNWIHALSLLGASVFMMLFLIRRRMSYPAIFMGLLSALWLGSNLTLTYAGHIGKFGVLLWACVGLYCLARALGRQAHYAWSILAGAAIGLMFLEQLDVALFFGLVLGAYALFLAIRLARASHSWWKPCLVLLTLGAMGLLFSFSNILSNYRINVQEVAVMQAESAEEKWAYATQWSWPPTESIDFIAPGYMGWRSGEAAGPYWGRMGRSAGWEETRQGFMNFKLENQYLGAIPILLALFALLAAIKGLPHDQAGVGAEHSERKAEIIFWSCAAGLTLLLAFGKYFPLYALFYKLPLISTIRNPNKFLQVFQLTLGILAAYGLDEALKYHRARTLRKS